jgi:uncharacterized membrane protein (DUF4010 family)
MGLIAIAMFFTVFAFGSNIFGWEDPDGWVQISLLATFVFGVLAGYRARN